MLRFEWEWQPAPEVRAPELRATWATLRVELGDVTATLVEDRGRRSAVRRQINVPTYPLAEWIAYRWWGLTSPTPKGGAGFRLADARDGFPWPDLTLQSGPGYVLADLQRVEREQESVRFLASAEMLLAPADVEVELRRFIEDTIQQLEGAHIAGTPLQQEWAAITSADDGVIAFCRTAAAFGLDPYDLDDSATDSVIELGADVSDAALLAEVAAGTKLADVNSAHAWLREALTELDILVNTPSVQLPFQPLPLGRWVRPWKLGFERARAVRKLLGLAPDQRLAIGDLVAMSPVNAPAPQGITGLAQASGDGTAVVVPQAASERTRRFAAARAIGRRTFDASPDRLLLTGRDEYAAKVERAFAAELLAPAEGIDRILGDSVTDEELMKAADEFNVSFRVIEHQLENQLGRVGP